MSTGRHTIKGFEHLRRVAAKALDNDDYRQRLLDNPADVLKQEGITVPDGVQVVVHQNRANEVHLVLPTGLQDETQLNVDETDVTTLSMAMHV